MNSTPVKQPRAKKKPCGNLYESWKIVPAFEGEKNTFSIRNIQSGEIFFNSLGAVQFGIREAMYDRIAALLYRNPERAEDIQSLALKTGIVTPVLDSYMRGADGMGLFSAVHRAIYCTGCRNRCAVVITGYRLDTDEDECCQD